MTIKSFIIFPNLYQKKLLIAHLNISLNHYRTFASLINELCTLLTYLDPLQHFIKRK